jgi:hypothetical protein
MAYGVGNPIPGLRQAQTCGGLNWLMGSKPSLFEFTIINDSFQKYLFH